jgi:cytochrome b6-f complex iron-sulfur subunit
MAAIRSNKAGGAAAPAAAAAPTAAAAPKAAPVAAVAAKPVGLSPAEMIRAARTAESGAPAAPKVVLPAKPLPGKAAPAVAPKAAAAPAIERRSAIAAIAATLLSPIVIAWTSFAATVTASTLALARFMMPNVLVEPPTRFKIGPPSDYSPGTVSTKWQAQFNIWVVNNEVDGVRCIYALSTVCTHLGCTPNWLEGEQKFKCPCHGSGFYKTGINFEGPAPRPLERVGLRLAEDGMLEVDKSVKFQRELGQWTNGSSFVGVG